MVILNILGKVEKTYISQKLGLYISNLPDGRDVSWNNWQEGIKDTIITAYETEKIEASHYIGKLDYGTENWFEKRVLEKAKKTLGLETETEEEILIKYSDFLSKNMICLDIDYQESEIPEGEQAFSSFGGGSCEEDPAEKILNFMDYIEDRYDKKTTIPHCIYSTSARLERDYRFLFSGTTDIEGQIQELKKVGKLLDDFLKTDKDFYQLDYLCNALFDIDLNERNTYHYMKVYSLCALFLEREKERELDYKLPYLMDLSIPMAEKRGIAELMRKIRNKIAHGDFQKANSLLEEYAKSYMDGKFWFDYSEYTRPSWVLLHISCNLENMLRKLIWLMLTDRDELERIKNLSTN